MTARKRTTTAAAEPTPREIGDEAAAAGIRLVAGSELAHDLDAIANETRDYVATFGIRPGTTLPIARGGTGAGTPAAAAVALNVPAWTDVAGVGNAVPNAIARFSAAGRLQVVGPVAQDDVATKGYVDTHRAIVEILPALLDRVDKLERRVKALEKGA